MLDKSVAENQSATIMILLIINKYLVFEQKLFQPIKFYYVPFYPCDGKINTFECWTVGQTEQLSEYVIRGTREI